MRSVKGTGVLSPRAAGKEKAEGSGEKLDCRTLRAADEGQDMHGSNRTVLGSDAII